MSNLVDFLSSIDSGSFGSFPFNFKTITFTEDGTYTAPYTGNYLVIACGGGGSGGTGDGNCKGGGGGGGSGFVYKVVRLSKGESVDVTIGAGGHTYAGENVDGSAGEPTSFGNYLTAAGGGGGKSYSHGGKGGAGVNYGGNGNGGNYEIPPELRIFLPQPLPILFKSGNGNNLGGGGGAGALGDGGNTDQNGNGYGSGSGGTHYTSKSLNGAPGICIIVEKV